MPGTSQRPCIVICDDDTILRGVIARVASDGGFRVVAQAEAADDALAKVGEFDADVLVTDLALRSGTGEDLIAKVAEERPSTRIIVFSAYTDRSTDLASAGTVAVVAKPDFTELEEQLRRVRASSASTSEGSERRRRDRVSQPMPAPTAEGPRGLEPWLSLERAVDALVPGDAVLGLDLREAGALARKHGDGFMATHRHEVAHLAAPLLRDHDRIAVTDDAQTVILLTAAHPEAPTAVFGRVEAEWNRQGAPGVLIGAFSHVRSGEDPRRTLARCLNGLRTDSSSSPPLRFT